MKYIIEDYLSSIDVCIGMFERKFGRRDLMKAASEGVIAKSGTLADGVKYALHGVGCRVEFSDHEIDFDFATSAGDVGFDAWRLLMFATQFPEKYPEYQDKEAVEKSLSELVASGLVVPVGGYSNLLELR